MAERRVAGMASESGDMRRQLLRAAYEVATPKGGSSASVHLHEVAKELGLKDPGRDEDVRNELTSMVLDLQGEGDVEGWSPTSARFKLTSKGASKAEGE
jgi:hypothetical protein